MTSGIYRIRNTLNGKVYIGSAVSIGRRWLAHTHYLNAGTHHCSHLQRAWNKYGATAFAFETIELASEDNLIVREQLHIDAEKVTGSVYNIAPTAGSAFGVKRTEETRAKMSALRLKSGFKHSQEALEKMAAAARGNTHRRGKNHTAEALAKMSSVKKGKRQSDETRAKLAAIHLGRKRSDEMRANMSLAQCGRVITPAHRAKISAYVKANPPSGSFKPGHKLAPEAIAKMAASLRGRTSSGEARKNMSLCKTGAKLGADRKYIYPER